VSADSVPTFRESEERDSDKVARRERRRNWAVGLMVVALLIGLAAAIGAIGGEFR
jgi:type IV secretory pathway component VirB8